MPDFMEENKEDVKKTESSPDSVAVELKRVRSSNKIFKIAAIVSATLFVLLLGVVIFVYQKLAGLRDLLMPPTETYQDSGFRAGGEGNSGELPPAFRGLLSSTRAAGGAALSVAKLNGSVVDSSLTVFTNAGEYSQGSGGITIAPAYDLLCLDMYGGQYDRDLALAVGDTFDPDKIRPYHLLEMCEACRLPKRRMARALATMARNMVRLLGGFTIDEELTGDERMFVDELVTRLRRNANRYLDYAEELPGGTSRGV